jgi:hypothetical protein
LRLGEIVDGQVAAKIVEGGVTASPRQETEKVEAWR